MKAAIFCNALIVNTSQPPQRIMTNWIQSVEEFRIAFDQLAHQAARLMAAGSRVDYTGQYPKHQVFQLLATMKRQLNRLLNDTDQSSSLSNLSAHTILLSTLSAQATLSMQLINLSAS
jgi:hypothetical protein